MDCRKQHQEVKYVLPKKCHTYMDTVLNVVKKEKIIEFSSGLEPLDDKTLKLDGHEFFQIAKLLHEQVFFLSVDSIL